MSVRATGSVFTDFDRRIVPVPRNGTMKNTEFVVKFLTHKRFTTRVGTTNDTNAFDLSFCSKTRIDCFAKVTRVEGFLILCRPCAHL